MALLTERWFFDILITSVSLIFFGYFYTTRKFNYWKSRGIPFEKPIPFFGTFKEVALFQTPIFKYLESVYKRTEGPYCGMFMFGEPCLLIKDPELIKSVLIKDFQYFSDRAITASEVRDPVGYYNVFIVKNPEWKAIRKTLTPLFTSGKIKHMFDLMNKVGQKLNKYIDNEVTNGIQSDCKTIFKKFSVDLVASCFFGVDSMCLNKDNTHFWKAAEDLSKFTYSRAVQASSYFIAPTLVKMFGFKFFDKTGTIFFKKFFKESVTHRVESKVVHNDLIDVLIDLKKHDPTIKDEKLISQMMVFFFAGFETSSSAILFVLYELSLQPQLQSKLRDDIKLQINKFNGVFSYESLHHMTYLDMVCSETFRKYATLPFLGRRCTKDYKLPGTDIVLDKDISIYISLMGLHYDPQYFPEPHTFDPERFSEENKRNYPSCAYMPFGEGPHNCLAIRFGLMSVKVGLVNILLNYEIENTAKMPTTITYDPKSFVLSPIEVLPIKFKKIN